MKSESLRKDLLLVRRDLVESLPVHVYEQNTWNLVQWASLCAGEIIVYLYERKLSSI